MSEFGNAPAGHVRARSEEYVEAVDMKAVDGRKARRCDSIDQLVDLPPWECDQLTLHFKLSWTAGWWQLVCRESQWKLNLYSEVNS